MALNEELLHYLREQRLKASMQQALKDARAWRMRSDKLSPYYAYYWTGNLASQRFWALMNWIDQQRSVLNHYAKEHNAQTPKG